MVKGLAYSMRFRAYRLSKPPFDIFRREAYPPLKRMPKAFLLRSLNLWRKYKYINN